MCFRRRQEKTKSLGETKPKFVNGSLWSIWILSVFYFEAEHFIETSIPTPMFVPLFLYAIPYILPVPCWIQLIHCIPETHIFLDHIEIASLKIIVLFSAVVLLYYKKWN